VTKSKSCQIKKSLNQKVTKSVTKSVYG